MKRFFFGFFTLFLFTSADVEVSDVLYKSEVTFNNEKFVLNGAGIREKFFLDLYTVGLYLKTKSFGLKFVEIHFVISVKFL